MSKADINQIVLSVDNLLKKAEGLTVEGIQDTVEETLMEQGFKKTAREYIRYRHLHEMRRNATQRLMESYDDLLFADAKDVDLKRDNANVNTDAPMGIMLKVGAEGMKTYAKYFALPEEFAEMHATNTVHIHDLDFSYITLNCCQIDLSKLFRGGFSTGHGFLREPNSIRAAASLACIVLQANQNDQFGGQSINAIDYALAPYVKKSFKKSLAKNFDNFYRVVMNGETYADDSVEQIKVFAKDIGLDLVDVNYQEGIMSDGSCFATPKQSEIDELFKKADMSNYDKKTRKRIKIALIDAYFSACKDVEEETKQATEALIHNLNTLHSRAGKMCA